MRALTQTVTKSAPQADLSELFTPRAIAVVGASETKGSVGRDVVENLLEKDYDGAILPVNPWYETVLGLPCFSRLADLPGPVDLVAIAIPAAGAPQAVAEAGDIGVPFAVVFASGFAEAGPDGALLQRDLEEAAYAANVRLLGPNCQGFMNIAGGFHVGFGPPYKLDYRKGRVSLVSQSGAFGNSLLIGLSDEGVGLRHYASTGNEADLGAIDIADAMIADPQSTAVGAYVEGLREPGRLRALAEKARNAQTPLVIWKVGRSAAGAIAAASHTASMTGDDRLYRTAFRQFGIVEVGDISEMADALRALSTGRKAKGPRLGLVTVSGGAGVAMADRAEELGLQLARFSPQTLQALGERLPKFASVGNPLDVTAGAVLDPASLAETLGLVAADVAVDMLALTFAGASGSVGSAIAEAVSNLHARTDLPITVSWNAPRSKNADAYDKLESIGVPVYSSPARAVGGLAAIWRGRSASTSIAPLTSPPEAAELPTLLDEATAKKHLTDTGIRSPREAVVHTADDAIEAFRAYAGPVVAKLLSSKLTHKSDLGAVRLGLETADDVRRAFQTLRVIPETLAPPQSFEGVLIQEQIIGGLETIVGARIDPAFGPIVLFGMGGIYAEVFEDIALRLAPIDFDEARTMIGETKIAKVLTGARGAPPADIDALADALTKLSQRIARPDTELQEIEINPLFVMPKGDGVIAGDCVVRIRSPGAEEAAPGQQ